MSDFAFFIVPNGDWQHLPAPLEPTIFTLADAMRALRAGLTLGMRVEAGRDVNVASFPLQLRFKRDGALAVGEDLIFGGRNAGDTTYPHGYLTISLWRPAPG